MNILKSFADEMAKDILLKESLDKEVFIEAKNYTIKRLKESGFSQDEINSLLKK